MQLELKDVGIQFGGLKVIEGFNLTVNSGELVGLIGPNGAGKTTAFNLISGVYRPTRGSVWWDGVLLNRLPPHAIARRGIVRTFQNIRLFADLDVLSNILVPMHNTHSYGLWDVFLRTAKFRRLEYASVAYAHHLLNFFISSTVPMFWRDHCLMAFKEQLRLRLWRLIS